MEKLESSHIFFARLQARSQCKFFFLGATTPIGGCILQPSRGL